MSRALFKYRSTRNTRIERLWVEVGTQFARQWRAFFTRLEHLHGLERSKPQCLWLLHHLFLDEINLDCKEFQLDWNHHPISGPKGKGRSPTASYIIVIHLNAQTHVCVTGHPIC